MPTYLASHYRWGERPGKRVFWAINWVEIEQSNELKDRLKQMLYARWVAPVIEQALAEEQLPVVGRENNILKEWAKELSVRASGASTQPDINNAEQAGLGILNTLPWNTPAVEDLNEQIRQEWLNLIEIKRLSVRRGEKWWRDCLKEEEYGGEDKHKIQEIKAKELELINRLLGLLPSTTSVVPHPADTEEQTAVKAVVRDVLRERWKESALKEAQVVLSKEQSAKVAAGEAEIINEAVRQNITAEDARTALDSLKTLESGEGDTPIQKKMKQIVRQYGKELRSDIKTTWDNLRAELDGYYKRSEAAQAVSQALEENATTIFAKGVMTGMPSRVLREYIKQGHWPLTVTDKEALISRWRQALRSEDKNRKVSVTAEEWDQLWETVQEAAALQQEKKMLGKETVFNLIDEKNELVAAEEARLMGINDASVDQTQLRRAREELAHLRHLLSTWQDRLAGMMSNIDRGYPHYEKDLSGMIELEQLEQAVLEGVKRYQEYYSPTFWEKYRELGERLQPKIEEWVTKIGEQRRREEMNKFLTESLSAGRQTWGEAKSARQRQQTQLQQEAQAAAAAAQKLTGVTKEDLQQASTTSLAEALPAQLQATNEVSRKLGGFGVQNEVAQAVTQAAARIDERTQKLAERLETIKEDKTALTQEVQQLMKRYDDLIKKREAECQKNEDEYGAGLDAEMDALMEQNFRQAREQLTPLKAKRRALEETLADPVTNLPTIKTLGEDLEVEEKLNEEVRKVAAEQNVPPEALQAALAVENLNDKDTVLRKCADIDSLPDFYDVLNSITAQQGYAGPKLDRKNFTVDSYFQDREGNIYKINQLSGSKGKNSKYYGTMSCDLVKPAKEKETKEDGFTGPLPHFAYWMWVNSAKPIEDTLGKEAEAAEKKIQEEKKAKARKLPRPGRWSLLCGGELMAAFKDLTKVIKSKIESRTRRNSALANYQLAKMMEKFSPEIANLMKTEAINDVIKLITTLAGNYAEIGVGFILGKYHDFMNNPQRIVKNPIVWGAVILQVIGKNIKTRQQVYEDFLGPVITGKSDVGAGMGDWLEYYGIPMKLGDNLNLDWGKGMSSEYEKGKGAIGETRDINQYFALFKNAIKDGRMPQALAIFDKLCDLGASDIDLTAMALGLMSARRRTEEDDEFARKISDAAFASPIPWMAIISQRGAMELLHDIAEQEGCPLSYDTNAFTPGAAKNLDAIMANHRVFAEKICRGGILYRSHVVKKRDQIVIRGDDLAPERILNKGESFNVADLYKNLLDRSRMRSDRADSFGTGIHANLGLHTIAMGGKHEAQNVLNYLDHRGRFEAFLDKVVTRLGAGGDIAGWEAEARRRFYAGFAQSMIMAWKLVDTPSFFNRAQKKGFAQTSIYNYKPSGSRLSAGELFENVGFIFNDEKNELVGIKDAKSGVIFKREHMELGEISYNYGKRKPLSASGLEDTNDVEDSTRRAFLVQAYQTLQQNEVLDDVEKKREMSELEANFKRLYNGDLRSYLVRQTREEVRQKALSAAA